MIRDEAIPELGSFRRIERTMSINGKNEYEPLVVSGGNDSARIHGWFHFKEAFSGDLLQTFLNEFGHLLPHRSMSMLDPFCGSGTSLLSAQIGSGREILPIGIERNPFIHFVAQTKVNWQTMNYRSLVEDGEAVLDHAELADVSLPDLSSILTGRCISNHIARRLIAADEAARRLPRNAEFVRLGIAAGIEPLSKVRRDGRALRIVSKPRKLIRAVLRDRWQKMAQDAEAASSSISRKLPTPRVLLGDGRNPCAHGIDEGSIDLLFTSPPYPNNIDYSEVYKLELWIQGFVKSSDEFLSLRHATVRSHPTFDKRMGINNDFLNEVDHGALGKLLGAVVKRLEHSGESWRAKMLLGYFSDLWDSVKSYRHILAADGVAAFVVGNSLHGSDSPAVIATDLILARIAESLGFRSQVLIARGLKRRLVGNHFLRNR